MRGGAGSMELDLSRAQWRKSSYSGNSGNCVEVAHLGQVVAIRDSKEPQEAVVVVTSDEWRKFMSQMRKPTDN
jgi:hypothetical protein